MSEQDSSSAGFLSLTADVVAAFVGNNSVPASELPDLIAKVHGALLNLANPAPAVTEEVLKPAVSVKKSVTPEYIICLEDGLKFKSLKRHLRTKYNMTPEEYRAKWACRTIIRWWRRAMLPRAPTSRRRWGSASSARSRPRRRRPPRAAAAAARRPDRRSSFATSRGRFGRPREERSPSIFSKAASGHVGSRGFVLFPIAA